MHAFFQKKLLFYILVVFFIVSCNKTSSEQQIMSQITKMQQALSDKSLSDFMHYFSNDFIGNKKLSRAELRQLIFFHFQRNRKIKSYQWQADINIEQQLAKVTVYVIVSGGNTNLPERGRLYTIKSSWIKTVDGWKINNASWEDKNFNF